MKNQRYFCLFIKINLSSLNYILLMQLGPKIYKIQNGQLKVKDENTDPCAQPEPYKVIKYTHTIRATPDDYHTQMIKQYKQQNEELRKNYRQLQKAYFNLLGYCQQNFNSNNQATPIHMLYKDGTFPNSTEICESMSKYSSANVSSFELEEMMMENEESRKKLNRLSQSILQQEQIHDFRQKFKQQQQVQKQTQGKIQDSYQNEGRRIVKTEVDEDIEDLLIQAFKEVQELRQMLEAVKQNSSAQIEQLKAHYEQKIVNLEIILQKQRKQSRMLNGVINRMRDELQAKQNFFRSVKQIKNGPEKSMLQKLLKQYKVLV